MSIVAERAVLPQAGGEPASPVRPLLDEHERTKEALPQRPRGPHPYLMQVGGAGRVGDAEALLPGFEDDAAVGSRPVSWIGAAA